MNASRPLDTRTLTDNADLCLGGAMRAAHTVPTFGQVRRGTTSVRSPARLCVQRAAGRWRARRSDQALARTLLGPRRGAGGAGHAAISMSTRRSFMKLRFLLVCAVTIVSISAGAMGQVAAGAILVSSAERGVIDGVIDGDTLSLRDGRRVRLVQIDTPELGTGECYSRAAANVLRTLAPVGAIIQLEADSQLDDVDRYGRLLPVRRPAGRQRQSGARPSRRRRSVLLPWRAGATREWADGCREARAAGA